MSNNIEAKIIEPRNLSMSSTGAPELFMEIRLNIRVEEGDPNEIMSFMEQSCNYAKSAVSKAMKHNTKE